MSNPDPTLRDWLAIHEPLSNFRDARGYLRPDVAEAVMHYPLSALGNTPTPLAAIRWWAHAEAKMRYLQADAMLAARKGGKI